MESNKNYITYTLLQRQGYDRLTIVSFLLKVNNNSQSQVARRSGVTRPFVSQVISGKRNSQKIKEQIVETLGFDPWG